VRAFCSGLVMVWPFWFGGKVEDDDDDTWDFWCQEFRIFFFLLDHVKLDHA